MAKETAEQKLLKLIEATEAQEPASAAAPSSSSAASVNADAQKTLDSVQSLGMGTLTLPSGIGQLFQLIRNPATMAQIPQTLSVRELNKVLFFALLLVGAYFVSDFSKGMKSAQRSIQVEIPALTSSQKGLAGRLENIVKDVTEYMSLVSYRNIFQPFERKVEVVDEAVEEVLPNQLIAEKLNQFKLVGISWLESPDSVTVMIEDHQTEVTHFLKTGEEFLGVKVEKIYADSVDFSYMGERMNVRL